MIVAESFWIKAGNRNRGTAIIAGEEGARDARRKFIAFYYLWLKPI